MAPRPKNERKKILRRFMNFLPEKELKLKKRIFLLKKRILFDQSIKNVKDIFCRALFVAVDVIKLFSSSLTPLNNKLQSFCIRQAFWG
jgi:hypothetical protein